MKNKNSLLQGLKDFDNITYTDNLMQAKKTTNSKLLDLFASFGSMGDESKGELLNLIQKALNEDPLNTLKSLFYLRDIREGLGRRSAFRLAMNFIAQFNPDYVKDNIYYFHEFGRWDDLFCLIGTPVEDFMFRFISQQLKRDIDNVDKGESISLLAKWMPSENASSSKTKKMAKLIIEKLDITPRQYRKMLTFLRKHIKVTESLMSANKWEEINYGTVPSIAMKNYRNAFLIKDNERFEKYLQNVIDGIEKINASTLYPYDIIREYRQQSFYMDSVKENAVLEEQWKALPNYVDTDDNILVMADTSGSMTINNELPLNTSLGLAIYLAERNKGVFKNTFLTFSANPQFVQLKGNSLYEKLSNIEAIHENTNIEAAFELILDIAKEYDVKSDELPRALLIVSDMQFDYCASYYGTSKIKWDFYTEMKNRFEAAGYTIPNIVFWNVDSKTRAYHAISNYEGVQLVSGHSTAIFKQVLGGFNKTPYESMMTVLNRERYNVITI